MLKDPAFRAYVLHDVMAFCAFLIENTRQTSMSDSKSRHVPEVNNDVYQSSSAESFPDPGVRFKT